MGMMYTTEKNENKMFPFILHHPVLPSNK